MSACKTFKPYEIEYRQVVNIRGKSVDKMTRELYKSKDYNPWGSIYQKDYHNHGFDKECMKTQNKTVTSLPGIKHNAKMSQTQSQMGRTGSQKNFGLVKTTEPKETLAMSKGVVTPVEPTVYGDDDLEFLKKHQMKDHFPDTENPLETELDG